MEGKIMKKIIAVALTLVMLGSTFAVMNNVADAKTKKGYYFAAMQKKKSPFGYIKKAKVVVGKKVVVVQPKATEQVTTEQNTEQPTTVAPTTQPETKIVYGKTAKVITYGSFMYRKTDKGASKKIKAKKRTFIISKKCKFYDNSWAKKKKISRTKAFKKFKKIKKTSWDNCEFVVKNGKVVVLKFGK